MRSGAGRHIAVVMPKAIAAAPASATISVRRPISDMARPSSIQLPAGVDRKLGQCRFQRWHKIGAVIGDADIGVDLERDRDAVIGVMAQTGHVARYPPSVAVD